MTEKKVQLLTSGTRRCIYCVITLSFFVLLTSCFTLLRPGSNPMLPGSLIGLWFSDANTSERIGDPDAYLTILGDSQQSYELRESTREVCGSNNALLKVYMYDLPPKFHFGLMGWKGKGGQVWPDVGDVNSIPTYPGGLTQQHSVEYWMTMDLLASGKLGPDRPCTAVRVSNPSEADVIFVPFFASLSYNRDRKLHRKDMASRDRLLQYELVKYLHNQEAWKRWGGKDHLIVAHHPNSNLDARTKLQNAMFVLADFGRYPVEIANIQKDIIAPYKHMLRSVGNDSASFQDRPLLVYFQGAIYRKDGGIIRQELYQMLKDEKDVHFAYGSVKENGVSQASRGMTSSKFCLSIAGDTPSSSRLFDAIANLCVPVIISDDIELPFEDVLDYSKFSISVRASDAVKKDFLLNLLRGITKDEWIKMWGRLKEVAHHFEFQYPSKEEDAVQMIWKEVSLKVSSVKLKLHKDSRFHL